MTVIKQTDIMIQRILNYFKTDGLLHLMCSAVLCIILSAFVHVWTSVLITLGVGALKELVWDYALKKGTCELRDIVADVTGTAAGAACAAMLIYVQPLIN